MDNTSLKNCTESLDYDMKVLGAEDVQKFLGKSLSWIYEHYQQLGGIKVGGAILFPSERKIYECLFRKEDRQVHVRLPVQAPKVLRKRVQDEGGSKGGRSRKSKIRKIPGWKTDPDRHGIR